MKTTTLLLFLVPIIMQECTAKPSIYFHDRSLYVSSPERTISKENTTYFIDPDNGNDKNPGTESNKPWKTFRNVNQLILTKGNKVKILSAGTFRESLFLIGKGTSEFPVTVEFAPGRYDFFPQNAFKTKFHISNTNDAPDSLKAIVFYCLDSENINFKAKGAEVLLRGKAIEMCLNNCKNIVIEGISFDYNRPTVSELKVIKAEDGFADLEIHPDSKYIVSGDQLIWKGEGWEHDAKSYWQVFDPEKDEIRRMSIPVHRLNFEKIDENMVRVHFKRNPGFKEGHIYQNRNTFRDYAAIFMQRSENILWKNVNIYFMHGVGFVSQFCENITFDSLYAGPKNGSGRTCAAWADILHFSGCKGKLEVKNSFLSAANDDAVNVHGTHLKIVNIVSNKKIRVKFMHPQTYGFNAFSPGDSIEFISAKSLLSYSENVVTEARLVNEKEIELTLDKLVPDNIQANDVIENITWTPDVHISNTKISRIPTRGILLTTRGKVIIENNELLKTHMSGILISDDANSWFESGYVRDVTVRNNKFIKCGEPVIKIHPENSEIDEQNPVHHNILITKNYFQLEKELLISAKSTGNISILENIVEVNKSTSFEYIIKFKACPDTKIKSNSICVKTNN